MTTPTSTEPACPKIEPTDSRAEEKGYVVPTTALLLIPLMIFAAFAVDVGGWYSEAARAQRAADAAALAAVVYMPDVPLATAAMRDEAARNGFVDQPGCDTLPCTPTQYPQVVLEDLGGTSVKVTILTQGEVYFGGVVSDNGPRIDRFAAAQYILPVPMGNPTSGLGTGNLTQAGVPFEGMWLAVNGNCTGRQQGDHISSERLGTAFNCTGPANPQEESEGYYVILDFPENSDTVDWNVEFYEPGTCADGIQGASSYENWGGNANTTTRLETTLYKADLTVFSDEDNIYPANSHPPFGGAIDATITGNTVLWNRTAGCTVPRQWQTAFTVGTGELRGKWILNLRSRDVAEHTLNYFSIRVTPASGPNAGQVCNTFGGVGALTCPRVYAKDLLSLMALSRDTDNNDIFQPDQAAVFYLAEIGPQHAGKTLEVTLFDPGENMNNLQFIDPNLNRFPFDWETIDCSVHGVCQGTNDRVGTHSSCNTTADPAATAPQEVTTIVSGLYNCLPVTGQAFQNQTVRIRMDIPAGYTCNSVQNSCWWRVRYFPDPGFTATDRTVWQIRVLGDPVRLTE